MRFREKVKYLSKWNIDTILCIYFNHNFSLVNPEDFVINILIKKLNACFIAIGKNFCFGSHRKGNIIFLKEMGKKYNFEVHVTELLKVQHRKVSSTKIRKLLQNSNFKLAKQLLGRHFSISGKVIHGHKYGTQLGFPTANIALLKGIVPIKGTFIVKVFICKLKKTFFGVANIGTRPTMNGKQQNLEVHLINISINLYQKYIQVIFLKKIRDEIHFSSIKSLKIQIQNDIEKTHSYFHNHLNKTQ